MFITKKKPSSLSAEAYRRLRTNIKLYSEEKPLKTIVITSSIRGEGKSTVTQNLAYILSKDESKVLIIDCNLRKPSMHSMFSIENNVGLTDVLSGSCDLEKAIKNIEESLFLITSGSIVDKPSEILGSDTMKELLESVSNNFDYIIIDTSSILVVSDTLLLATQTDATIIVANTKKTTTNVLKQGYRRLIESKVNVIGTVLNNCNKSIDNKYYGYYERDRGNKHKKGERIIKEGQ